MAKLFYIMEDRFVEISTNGELMLDEGFMMDMFVEITNKVDAFAKYLEFMFTEKQIKQIGGCTPENDKVLPYDKLQAELCYPT